MTESETIEFKKSLAELSEGLVSIVAMLNKHGRGELWFGIKDRIEIRNPGGLLEGMSMDDLLRSYLSRRRNPIGAELLRRVKLVEVWARASPSSSNGHHKSNSRKELVASSLPCPARRKRRRMGR
jgi:hypothetical protein